MLIKYIWLLHTFRVTLISGIWYHRPIYYNRAHISSQHVDYKRHIVEEHIKSQTFGNRNSSFDSMVHKSYYVHILYKGSVLCPGVLISRRMIVTSARCFILSTHDPPYEYKAKHISVLTGIDIGKSTDTLPKKVIAFYMPSSEENITVHNIALVALTTKLRSSQYRYLKLYRHKPKLGDPVKIAFMEPTEYGVILYDTNVVDFRRCKSALYKHGYTNKNYDSELYCVQSKPQYKYVPCSTRPGDPLFIGSELAGINLYGERCAENKKTDIMNIYYAIRHTIKFIQTATDMLRVLTKTL